MIYLVEKAIGGYSSNIILNCGAYTAVDKAETEQN
jgi:dTDP-4-dehydrorhamnose reductase